MLRNHVEKPFLLVGDGVDQYIVLNGSDGCKRHLQTPGIQGVQVSDPGIQHLMLFLVCKWLAPLSEPLQIMAQTVVREPPVQKPLHPSRVRTQIGVCLAHKFKILSLQMGERSQLILCERMLHLFTEQEIQDRPHRLIGGKHREAG